MEVSKSTLGKTMKKIESPSLTVCTTCKPFFCACHFLSVRNLKNAFDDTAYIFKSQIKVLKEYIFVKGVQNDAYNKHKAELSNGDLLVHVDFAGSYRND